MGTWGTGLFEDDVASDVRDRYLGLLGEGLTGPQATRSILEEWAEALEDSDDAPIVWLALAVTQWEVGRLEDRVKREALKILGEGGDLARWAGDPAAAKARRGILEGVARQLKRPQASRRRIERRPIPKKFTAIKPGQVFSYRLGTGKLVLFRLLSISRDMGGEYPAFALLDWIGETLPALREIERLDFKMRVLVVNEPPRPVRFSVYEKRAGDYPADRIRIVIPTEREPVRQGVENSVLIDWRRLDAELEELGFK